jgi:hypothetical protein
MATNRSTAARVILAVALTIAAFIALSILLIVLDANEGNMIVNAIIEVGRFFSTPFHEMFPQSNEDRSVVINWGIGALIYVLVGGLVIRFLR